MRKIIAGLLGGALLIASSASFAYSSKPDEIIGNKDSLTANYNTIRGHYSLNILKDGEKDGKYTRVSVIKLDSTPVIVAVSQTSLNDKTFLNILQTTGDKRFGPRVRALDPHLTYYIRPKSIEIKEINNKTIYNYLLKLGYSKSDSVNEREILFQYKGESMTLTEYRMTSGEY